MARRVLTVSNNRPGTDSIHGNLQARSRLLHEANEELKKATRAKTELVSEMSHEFRKTLNVIIGFTEIMLDEVAGKINDEQRDSLQDILSGSQRLLYLVNNYLE
jgi:signal transduction histidine kinase